VKKTFIALAAASSVALSHGVAVAEKIEVDAKPTISSSTADGSPSADSSAGGTGENTTDPESEQGQGKPEATGSSKIFGWDEETGPVEKFTSIASAVAAVVGFLGSISALFANIEKIVKQFTK